MKCQLLNKLSYLKMKWASLKKKNLKQRNIFKKSWFDWLINYILKPIKNIANDLKDEVLGHCNLKTNKIVCGSGKKLSKPKIETE